MAGVGMLLARWRADVGLLVALTLVVALTAGLVGAVPRLLDVLARDSLDAAVDEATVDRSGLRATAVREVGGREPDRIVTALDTLATQLDDELVPELATVLQPPTAVADSVRHDLAPLPGDPAVSLSRKLTVRLQPGAEEHLRVVEGRLPSGTPERVALDLGDRGPDGEALLDELLVHQFAATAETADGLAMALGDRRLATPDPSGPVVRRVPFLPLPTVVVELVGIVELDDVADPVWFGDPRLHRTSSFDTNSSTTIFGTGLVTSAGAAQLPGATERSVASVDVRWRLDRAGLLDGDPAAVAAAATSLRTSAPLTVDRPRWATGLDRLLEREAARRSTAVEVLGLAATAVLGVAGALLLAIVAVLAVRRRDALGLVRGRGASRGQLLAAAVVEFGGVGVVAAALASGVLVAVLPGGRPPWVVVVVAVGAVVVLVAGSHRETRRRLGALLAERRRVQPRRPSGHVLDGLLVLVAVIAALALRRRGIVVDGAVQPLVVAAPLLVAAAAAVVAARIAPLPLRAAEAAARRGRGLAAPVGLASAARGAGGAVVVVLLVLGLGVAGLAAAVHRTLVEGQDRAASETVGADVRVDAAPLASLDPGWSPPGPDDVVVEVRRLRGVILQTGTTAQRVDAVLVDPAAMGAAGLASGLPALAWDGIGAAPLLVSRQLQPLGSPRVDAELTLAVDGDARIGTRIAGFDPRVLGLNDEDDGPYVVLDRAAVAAATGDDVGVTTRLVTTDDPAAVRAAALAADEDAEVLVRTEVQDALRTAPLARGVRVGYLVAAAAAVLATGAALVLALVATAPRRRRSAAVLAALGTSTSRVRTTMLLEVLPLVGGAAATGVVLAGGVALLLGGRLDLSPFTGTADATALVLPHWSVALLLVTGAVALAAIAAVLTQGRVDPGQLLREGDG